MLEVVTKGICQGHRPPPSQRTVLKKTTPQVSRPARLSLAAFIGRLGQLWSATRRFKPSNHRVTRLSLYMALKRLQKALLRASRRRLSYALAAVVLLVATITLATTGVLTHSTDQSKLLKTSHSVRRLEQQLKSMQQLKSTTDQQLQQKAKQIDDLNKQLQAKAAANNLAGAGGGTPAPTPTPAPQPTYRHYGNSYASLNCTWYVASRINVPDNLGNANTWAYMAGVDGYAVSNMPKVGAVAQTSGGALGHVAIVIAINNGEVEVSEMNYRGLGIIDERWSSISDWRYIYF